MIIDDDGRGFDTDDVDEGLGMGNLRDRITSLGGSIDVRSSGEEGTTIRALLPL